MIFKPHLAEQVLDGRKTQTRRPMSPKEGSPWYEGGCKLKAGESYAVQPGRSKHALGRVVVTAVRSEMLGEITDADAQREGFDDRAAFLAYWRELYGEDANLLDRVWVVSFGDVTRARSLERIVGTAMVR